MIFLRKNCPKKFVGRRVMVSCGIHGHSCYCKYLKKVLSIFRKSGPEIFVTGSLISVYPCDKQEYYNRVLDFFSREQLCPQDSLDSWCTLLHNDFNNRIAYCKISLVVTNTPWDGKVPVFKSDQDYFFFKQKNIPDQKNAAYIFRICKLRPTICLLMFCWLSCHI